MPDGASMIEKFSVWVLGLLALAWATVAGLLKSIYSNDKKEALTKIANVEINIKGEISSVKETLVDRLSHQDRILVEHGRAIRGLHSRLDSFARGDGVRRNRLPPRLTRQHRLSQEKPIQESDSSDDV